MITFTAVGYGYEHEWEVFINSLLLQTNNRWFCQLWNDGPDPIARAICTSYVEKYPNKFSYQENPKRRNKFGHDMRMRGLNSVATRYWSTQNVDNYLVPVFVEFTLAELEKGADLVVFPCVHNYANVDLKGCPPYSVLDTYPRKLQCDAGSFVVDAVLAKSVGWPSLQNTSDGDFINAIMEREPSWSKLSNVLMVHN